MQIFVFEMLFVIMCVSNTQFQNKYKIIILKHIARYMYCAIDLINILAVQFVPSSYNYLCIC